MLAIKLLKSKVMNAKWGQAQILPLMKLSWHFPKGGGGPLGNASSNTKRRKTEALKYRVERKLSCTAKSVDEIDPLQNSTNTVLSFTFQYERLYSQPFDRLRRIWRPQQKCKSRWRNNSEAEHQSPDEQTTELVFQFWKRSKRRKCWFGKKDECQEW